MRVRPRPWDSLPAEDGGRLLVVPVEAAPSFPSPSEVVYPLEGLVCLAVLLAASACPTHESQRTHPKTVPALPQLTTDMGDMRSW